MSDCIHTIMQASLDRWQECHWHLHQMEANYHEPEPFRFSFNSFIRAVKEVPNVLVHDLQRRPEVKRAIEPELGELRRSELFSLLGKRRDFVVHRGMLELNSKGSVGTTEGSRIKISFPFYVAPTESSDEAYERYKQACRTDKLLRGLGPDCDSAPALWRTWQIPQLPDRDLLDVAFEAWQAVGQVLSDSAVAAGEGPLDLRMPCRHNPENVRVKRFGQHQFFLEVDGIDLEEVEREYREQAARERNARPKERRNPENPQ